jgi:type IV secretory pathway ATPase VirB11/archaellum biosynthesis ATPase
MNIEAEPNKIIVWCQTGSLKTTILNSLLNFILVVGFEDDFRYTIIDGKKVQKNQVIYQTKKV